MKNILERFSKVYQRSGVLGVLDAFRRRLRNIPRGFWWKARKFFSSLQGNNSVLTAYGVYLSPNWSDATFRFCVEGSYGEGLSDFLAKQKSGFVFVDIGANQGLYSLVAAKNNHCICALAVEPVKSTYALLTKNIALNKADQVIKPLRFAISEHECEASIWKSSRHSGIATLENAESVTGIEEERVEVKPFSALEEHLDARTPVIIKIDVEGHELSVIRSILSAEDIVGRVTDIIYEVNEGGIDDCCGTSETLLTAEGFVVREEYYHGTSRDIHVSRASI